jgi:cyclophilin family peptidyl-prolyl cis-trans isomerase
MKSNSMRSAPHPLVFSVSVLLLAGFTSATLAQAPADKSEKKTQKVDAKAKANKSVDGKQANKKAAADQPPPTAPPGTPARSATEGPATGSQATTNNRPAVAEYQRLLGEWKAILGDLRRLKLQYQSAALADQAKIQDEWKVLITRGNETVALLEQAGLRAYEEAPNEDPELARFLVKLSDDAVQRDDYAAAKRLTDVLIAHNCPDKQIYDSAAVAAFVLNDYDTAEKYFKQAKDLGVFSNTSKELEPILKEYRDLWAKEKDIREAEAKADDLPRVKLTTTKGVIVLELFENEAPETVGNFVSLVEAGKYDATTFHRVLKGFMAQGGDPKGDGTGGPGYRIFGEQSRPNHRMHFQGSLSMAHTGDPDTGGSQFFITFRQTKHLNGLHTCFGRVIEGMDVLPLLQRRDPTAPNAPSPDSIIKAEVVRKRDHVYQPHKVE